MSSIRVRTRADKSTYTQVCFRHNGTQTSESFDDHEAGLRWQTLLDKVGPEAALTVLRAQVGVKAEDIPTLEEWLLTYISSRTKADLGTLDRYRAMVRNDFEADLLALPLTALTDTRVGEWVQAQKARGSAGKTIANKHGFLSGALKVAARKKLILANPCEETQLPRSNQRRAVFLRPPEFQAILVEMPERWHAITLFLVSSGARFSEASALTVADIDHWAQTCSITKAWKDTRAKGKARWQIGYPKTEKSTRTINLAPQIFEYLDLARDPSEFLFLNTRGRNVAVGSYYHNVWKPAVARAGAKLHGKQPRVHDLRHTCASWLIAARVPLPVIQEHLGHESITTTIHTYGHLDRSAHLGAAAAISNALAGTTGQLGPIGGPSMTPQDAFAGIGDGNPRFEYAGLDTATALAQWLTDEAGVPVELEGVATGNLGRWSGVALAWQDGPTVDAMRELAAQVIGPSAACGSAADIVFYRLRTPLRLVR
ncbi:tyrosine-type recombinase/integrase [Nocardia sp. NPDC059240]|uniref:tyrosine-type recombinase/integrase n=1 Tax=Nocardia sp. NPDC059240 TaxID=3346786 RepID=UPI00367763E5